jgi:hypothetical protein
VVELDVLFHITVIDKKCIKQGAKEVPIHCEIISPIRGFLVNVLVKILFKKKSWYETLGLGRDSNPDPSALKPSECTTTPPSISSFMCERKCSKENRKVLCIYSSPIL